MNHLRVAQLVFPCVYSLIMGIRGRGSLVSYEIILTAGITFEGYFIVSNFLYEFNMLVKKLIIPLNFTSSL